MAAEAAVQLWLGLGGCAAEHRHLARRASGRPQPCCPRGPPIGHALQQGQVQLELEAIVENLHPWSERRCLLTLEIFTAGRHTGDNTAAMNWTCCPDARRCATTSTFPIRNSGGRTGWASSHCTRSQPASLTTRRAPSAIAFVPYRLADRGDRPRTPPRRQPLLLPRQRPGGVLPRRQHRSARHDTRAHHRREVRGIGGGGARHANMNMLRINGCSIYEAPAFYDACDRMGMLIWHDFMLTCTTYPDRTRRSPPRSARKSNTVVPLAAPPSVHRLVVREQ